MDLVCNVDALEKYHSNSQLARVITERWFSTQMYCPGCESNRLVSAPNNCPGIDFNCPDCDLAYQLKSSKSPIRERIVDSAYDAMIRAIRSERAPNLFVLHYSPAWAVTNLLLIPKFFITESAIERRRPLSPTARRAGWIGCNIVLYNIPPDGRISFVTGGTEISKKQVRGDYARVQPLAELGIAVRGWTLDVLNVLRRIDKSRFSLADVYSFEPALTKLHPSNRNVRPKIRQQLQVLRDLGYLRFSGDGHYQMLR